MPHPPDSTTTATATATDSWKTRKTLIDRLGSDCQASWDKFHRSYRGFVASIAVKFGIPAPEVDDLSQRIFLEVHRDLTSADAPDFSERSFGAWLGQKVKWRVLEFHRHRHRREHATDPADLPDHADHHPFDRLWDGEWQRKLVETALQRIEEKPRNLLVYQALALQEMPVVEVCERFGISRSNADTIKKRVKDKLAVVIREIEAGEI